MMLDNFCIAQHYTRRSPLLYRLGLCRSLPHASETLNTHSVIGRGVIRKFGAEPKN